MLNWYTCMYGGVHVSQMRNFFVRVDFNEQETATEITPMKICTIKKCTQYSVYVNYSGCLTEYQHPSVAMHEFSCLSSKMKMKHIANTAIGKLFCHFLLRCHLRSIRYHHLFNSFSILIMPINKLVSMYTVKFLVIDRIFACSLHVLFVLYKIQKLCGS